MRFLFLTLLLARCSLTKVSVSENLCPLGSGRNNSLFVVVSDFRSAGVRKIDLPTGKVLPQAIPAHGDAITRVDAQSGQVVVVNRAGGNHLTFAPLDLSRVLGQMALPEQSSPYDVCLLNPKQMYVSLNRSVSLVRKDRETGKDLGVIDLSAWSDSDGFPEAAYLHRLDGSALLTLQRIETKQGYVPAGTSYLLRIDPARDKIEQVVPLARANPFSEIRTWGSDLFLAEAGRVDLKGAVLDGGIERLDSKTLQSKGVIDEEWLGGDVFDLEILSEDRGLAIIGKPDRQVVVFDLQKRVPSTVLLAGKKFQYSHLLADRERGLIYITDRDPAHPGILVYRNDLSFRGRIALEGIGGLGDGLPPFHLSLAP